jgi:hypothetical protein
MGKSAQEGGTDFPAILSLSLAFFISKRLRQVCRRNRAIQRGPGGQSS